MLRSDLLDSSFGAEPEVLTGTCSPGPNFREGSAAKGPALFLKIQKTKRSHKKKPTSELFLGFPFMYLDPQGEGKNEA